MTISGIDIPICSAIQTRHNQGVCVAWAYSNSPIQVVTFLTSFYSSSLCFLTIIAHLHTQGRAAERLESGRKFTLDH